MRFILMESSELKLKERENGWSSVSGSLKRNCSERMHILVPTHPMH